MQGALRAAAGAAVADVMAPAGVGPLGAVGQAHLRVAAAVVAVHQAGWQAAAAVVAVHQAD